MNRCTSHLTTFFFKGSSSLPGLEVCLFWILIKGLLLQDFEHHGKALFLGRRCALWSPPIRHTTSKLFHSQPFAAEKNLIWLSHTNNLFLNQGLIALQGAAFDLPDFMAAEVLAKKEELTSRGFSIDQPASLPVEQTSFSEEQDYGGNRGGYRGGRGGYGGRGGGGGSYGGRGNSRQGTNNFR